MSNCLYLGSKLYGEYYDTYLFISGQDQVENSAYLTAGQLHQTKCNKETSVDCNEGKSKQQRKINMKHAGSLYVLVQRDSSIN